jgi:hypothetical protein
MTVQRVPDWEAVLSSLVSQRLREPFCWGRHDCSLWAADAVLAITGRDFAEGLRGVYHDARSAQRILVAAGGLSQIVTAALGEPIPPLFARPGDIGLVEVKQTQVLAVCNGSHWLAVAPDGLGVVDINKAIQAWKVG